MNLAGLAFLLVAHYFTGRGILRLFKVNMSAMALSCFAMIVGVTIHSMVPCIMELLHVPITNSNTYMWIAGSAVLASIPLLLRIRQTRIPKLELPQIYELPFLIIFVSLAVISVWRCWYFPPTPRDVLTGVELIAERTVIEHKMVNSAFSVDVRLNGAANNIFKSPFITGLQIMYKQMVVPFGQLWLSVLFISFTTWLYTMLREVIHPLLAGILLLIYFAIPDLYAYTYIILYDYPNMVLFFIGYYYIIKFLESRLRNELILAAFFFGLATYVRSETLVLACMVTALMALQLFRKKVAFKDIAITCLIFIAGPLLFNFILSNIFIKNLIPYQFKLGELLNADMMNFDQMASRFKELLIDLMFSKKGEAVYAHFYIFFLVVLIPDLLFTRKLSQQAAMYLWGALIVFVTLALLCHIIPSHTVINSAKRGLFKIIPLMLLYMAHSGLLQKLSNYLRNRENRGKEPAAVPLGARPPVPPKLPPTPRPAPKPKK